MIQHLSKEDISALTVTLEGVMENMKKVYPDISSPQEAEFTQ